MTSALSHSHSPRRASPATEIGGEAGGCSQTRHRNLFIACHSCGFMHDDQLCRVCGSHSLVLVVRVREGIS